MSDLYHTQRAMREMRKAALQRGVIAILDIGTFKIGCLLLKFDESARARAIDGVGPMAGQSNFKVIGVSTTRSRGMRFGEVAQMGEAERAIRTVVQSAQKMANVRVDHAIVTFSGGEPRSYGLAGQIEMQGGVVSEQDVARVLAACDVPPLGEAREVLHAQPVNFALDHRSGLGDPRGQAGGTLACDMHLLSIDAAVVKNILTCVARCDLEVAGIASSAYVSGVSSLVEDEQELGAACIDMGGGTTSVSIFMRKHMIFADSVRMGGDHITNDISKGLGVPKEVAERMKTKHGGVLATSMDDREMIDMRSDSGGTGDYGDHDYDSRQISRSDLIGIMRPRVEEILEETRACLDAAGFDSMASRQIVLTGGSSQIPGLDDLASRILGQRVRMGRPLRVQGLPQAATGPAYSSAVGLCLFAAHPQDEWWDFEALAPSYPTRSLRRAVRWFKDNW